MEISETYRVRTGVNVQYQKLLVPLTRADALNKKLFCFLSPSVKDKQPNTYSTFSVEICPAN